MRTKPTPQEHDVLDDDEIERIEDIIRDAEHSNLLTAWEDEFVESIRDRLFEYGTKTRISAKQWEILERIEEKLHG